MVRQKLELERVIDTQGDSPGGSASEQLLRVTDQLDELEAVKSLVETFSLLSAESVDDGDSFDPELSVAQHAGVARAGKCVAFSLEKWEEFRSAQLVKQLLLRLKEGDLRGFLLIWYRHQVWIAFPILSCHHEISKLRFK